MHLCFIDESGSPPKPNRIGKRTHFVIAGVIMHEAQWAGVASEVRTLCSKPAFNVRGEIKWRYFGPENTDDDNSVGHLKQEQRDAFRRELFGILAKRKSIKIVACVCHCEVAYKQKFIQTDEDIYQYTYKPVSERFQYYLQDTSRVVGEKQNGIIVADHRGTKQDNLLRRHHHSLVEENSMFVSTYANYIETVFLTPSHLSIGIQLADMVAGAIGRFANTGDRTYFDLIEGSLRARPDGNYNGFGLVKFPNKGW